VNSKTHIEASSQALSHFHCRILMFLSFLKRLHYIFGKRDDEPLKIMEDDFLLILIYE